MPATVRLVEKNGSGPTLTDKTAGVIRFKNADNAVVDTNAPMVKPAAGQKDFSFEKWLRLEVTGGTYIEITNIRAYTDGAIGWSGARLWWRAAANYAVPIEPLDATGFTDATTFTSGAPLSLGAGPFTGNGEHGDHLVMCLEIDDTVAGGLAATEPFSVAWDEI